MKSIAPLAALLLLAACNANVTIDPEGYRCNVGNTCPSGFQCVDNVCRRGEVMTSCTGVVCNQPPAATCADTSTLRTFVGRCASGQCAYDPVDMACASACSNGACVDACAGVTCTTPPATACVDASTLRTFAQTGTCNGGSCGYQQTDMACPNGCMNGRCQGVDLCRMNNVMCTTPPAATCSGNALRTFAATGTCDPGTGACTYAPTDMNCPSGCANAMCLTPSLSFAQTGPRLRFAVNALDIAPGSSGGSPAIAVGNGGRAARWDGATWSDLTTSTTADLNAVAFVSGALAYAVGSQNAALTIRGSTGAVTPVSLSGSSNNELIAVTGRSEMEVLIASDSGETWRMRGGGNFNSSTVPMSSGTPSFVAAYMDESLRERIVGRCGSSRCTAYRNAGGGTPNWIVNTQTGTTGFTAVGGGFDIPTSATASVAFLGAGLTLVTHDTGPLNINMSPYGTQSTSPVLEGTEIIGITAQSVAIGRDVFVLTSRPSSGSEGKLFRVARGVPTTSAELLRYAYGEAHLSPNESSGVLVAEVRRTQNVNNIFRRGVVSNEAIDVGEDFVGATTDGTGALYFVSAYADVIIRRSGSTVFEFRRPPTYDYDIRAAEARNGTGVLMVGEDSTTEGVIIRFTAPNTFTTLTTPTGTEPLNAVCRVSDTEAWAVGNLGTIFRISGTTATRVTSGTTANLRAVDCVMGVAVACGDNGTVLRFANNTWGPGPAGLNTTTSLTTCKLTPSGGIVGGNNVLAAYQAGGWTMGAGLPNLGSLVLRGAGEVYGTSLNTSGNTSTIHRFDGSTWSPALLNVSGVLGGGVQVGGRVVWGGTLGAIVESR